MCAEGAEGIAVLSLAGAAQAGGGRGRKDTPDHEGLPDQVWASSEGS